MTYTAKANPNASSSELDAKVIITYDATNQPEDWDQLCEEIGFDVK